MGLNKQAIKSRIKSINATKKITSAMELIANAKLVKYRNIMDKNREYTRLLESTISDILVKNKDIDHIFIKDRDNSNKFVIVYASDLGLCGGYNSNMLKVCLDQLTKDDMVVVIGKKLYTSLKKYGFNIINDISSSDYIEYEDLKGYIDIGIDAFINNDIGSISVIYTEFINTISFDARYKVLLPASVDDYIIDNKMKKEMEFQPNVNEIIDSLVPMMLYNVTYGLLLQSKTSEQASRRIAMESATKNAIELNDKLVLAFNQARQAAITQEITEIVAGADAI